MTSVVFMGTPAFSVPILRMVHEEGYEVLAVVTQPDRPVGRKRVLTPPPVKDEAIRLGLHVIQPEKLRDSSELDEILSLNPDIIITATFGQILPKNYWMLHVWVALMFMHRCCLNIVEVHQFTRLFLMEKKKQVSRLCIWQKSWMQEILFPNVR